jgi:hypothetical protein
MQVQNWSWAESSLQLSSNGKALGYPVTATVLSKDMDVVGHMVATTRSPRTFSLQLQYWPAYPLLQAWEQHHSKPSLLAAYCRRFLGTEVGACVAKLAYCPALTGLSHAFGLRDFWLSPGPQSRLLSTHALACLASDWLRFGVLLRCSWFGPCGSTLCHLIACKRATNNQFCLSQTLPANFSPSVSDYSLSLLFRSTKMSAAAAVLTNAIYMCLFG